MKSPSIIRILLWGFVAALNLIAALYLGLRIWLFVFLNIGFSTHNDAPWLTGGEVVTIIVVDTLATVVMALVLSKVLSLVNRLLKLPAKLATGLFKTVFVAAAIGLLAAFFQGFMQFVFR